MRDTSHQVPLDHGNPTPVREQLQYHLNTHLVFPNEVPLSPATLVAAVKCVLLSSRAATTFSVISVQIRSACHMEIVPSATPRSQQCCASTSSHLLLPPLLCTHPELKFIFSPSFCACNSTPLHPIRSHCQICTFQRSQVSS